jgi:hypothetical protein
MRRLHGGAREFTHVNDSMHGAGVACGLAAAHHAVATVQ